MRPGTMPASAHRPQEMLMPSAAARLTASGLAAIAVMNIALCLRVWLGWVCVYRVCVCSVCVCKACVCGVRGRQPG
jgi:hypothetical protein